MNIICCDIRDHVAEEADNCATRKGGAYDFRICCLKNLAYTEDTCSSGAGNDAKVTDIDTIDFDNAAVPAPMFFKVTTKDKANEYKFTLVYDPASGGIKFGEEVNMVVEVKNRAFYCIIKKWVGQEIAIIFRERGSNKWYIAGRKGQLRVINIAGGTGTDTFTPTTIQIVGEDVDDIAVEIFDTDTTTTDNLVESQTAA